ncbi:MAG: TIM barrel protein [Brevinematia bacterium]
MYKIGLKLWSINENYINEAIRLYEDGYYDYVELYAVPDSYDRFANLWKKLKAPFVIHAPHFGSGLNFSIKEQLETNRKYAFESFKFADLLKADKIIFHPGVNGDIEESIKQINSMRDDRMVIENKPYLGNGENLFSIGSTPEEIKFILDSTNISFCLDFGHAICSANAHKREVFGFIKEFLSLSPVMFHLTDGDFNGVYDSHLHYGDGSFPIDKLTSFVPEGAMITNESVKNYTDKLDDFVNDVLFLRKLFIKKRSEVVYSEN